MLKLYSCPLSGLFLVCSAFKSETHYECSGARFKIDPHLYSAHSARAKQAIYIFPPRDRKCLLHSTVLTGLEKDHSQEKK